MCMTTTPPRAAALVALAALLFGCFGNPPGVAGVAGTAPAPNTLWTPPPREHLAAAVPALPPDLAARVQQLKLTDVIDIALRNNTATRASWAQARAAAAGYGAAPGQWGPTLSIDPAARTLQRAPP